MVITQAAAGRSDVVHLVYVCAFMPEEGESLFMLTGGPAPWITVLEDGRTLPDPEHAARASYADCDPETRAAAIRRRRAQVRDPFVEPVSAAAWREIPTTYVVCTEDESMPVEVQRNVFAPRAQHVLELESSHAPFFSRPEELADLFADRASREETVR